MLKLLLPFSFSIMKSWNYNMALLLSATFITLPLLYAPHSNKVFLNTFSLDFISSPLILLTLWITSLMFSASYKINNFTILQKQFSLNIMALTIILIMSFSMNNMIMFYIMFEASLIPTMIIILGWGYQPERLQAGMYLMLYTIIASLPLLIALLYTHSLFKSSFFMFSLSSTSFSLFMALALSLAFLVKMPMYISHLWLPKAHVEAPVAGSMILASVLLKLGAYGMMRMMLMSPLFLYFLTPLFSIISMIGAPMTAFICLRQHDMKSLIAYSSIGHMALLITGLFSFSKWGWEGSILMMIAHGLSSSALFALANMYYEASNSRALMMMKGMLTLFPSMATWWFFMTAANMAAPPTLNLLSELLLLTSILYYSMLFLPFIAIVSFLAAAYSLYLFTSLHHGQTNNMINNISQPLTRNIYISFFHFIPLYFIILSPLSIVTS